MEPFSCLIQKGEKRKSIKSLLEYQLMHLLVVQNVREIICICKAGLFREQFSYSSPSTPVFCSDHKWCFTVCTMRHVGVGVSDSQPEAFREPAIVAPWILEVSRAVVLCSS